MKLLAVIIGGVGFVLYGQNLPPGPTPDILEREVEAYRRVLMDFGGLTRYGSDNTELRKRPEVVFIGDDFDPQHLIDLEVSR